MPLSALSPPSHGAAAGYTGRPVQARVRTEWGGGGGEWRRGGKGGRLGKSGWGRRCSFDAHQAQWSRGWDANGDGEASGGLAGAQGGPGRRLAAASLGMERRDGSGEGMASERRGKGGEGVPGAVYKSLGGEEEPWRAAKRRPINSHNGHDLWGFMGKTKRTGWGATPPN